MENKKYEIQCSANNTELAISKTLSAPVFTDKKGNNKWVPYRTADGNEEYPDYLLTLFNNSALHGRILRSVINQVFGNGFIWDPKEEGATEFAEWAKQPCKNSEDDLNEILKKYVTDYCTFGAGALKVDWDQDFSRVNSLEHSEDAKIRVSPINEYGNITGYWWSWDWTNNKSTKIFIPPFSTKDAKLKKQDMAKALEELNVDRINELFKFTTQLQYTKIYEPNSPYYPHPYYQSGMDAIETDIMAGQYEQATFDNGLGINFHINIPGNYTNEQKAVEAKGILKQHSGASKSGIPLITFSKNGDEAITVSKLENSGEDKLFTSINENLQQKILEAHGITSPLLCGISTPGSLGGKEELDVSAELYYKQVIQPLQNEISKAFNKIFEINNWPNVSIERALIFEEEEDVAIEDVSDSAESGNNTEIK